jgi:glucokinase
VVGKYERMNIPESFRGVQGALMVSCQADEQDAFHGHMDLFARAAVQGGAAGIRANGVQDISAIRSAVAVPIIGIDKVMQADGQVLITPSFDCAARIVVAGASAIALDCSVRGQQYAAFERLWRIKQELGVPVLADIATIEEATAAVAAGADFVLSTMRGYTAETREVVGFNPGFIRELVEAVPVPVIAEGRIDTPELAREALRNGAFAIVVGTAITRPQVIVKRFVEALNVEASHSRRGYVVAVDLGATKTKYGIVSSRGELLWHEMQPTPARSGQTGLLSHLQRLTEAALARAGEMTGTLQAVGIATAGWVNPDSGRVVYATENLPGWTGANIAEAIAHVTELPVSVENDANALAVGEHQFGRARDLKNFICITLGTGVGGGCYIGGQLNRGGHFFANALGHICIEPRGRQCSCGQRGCLEAYTNAVALLNYADGRYADAEELIAAAREGESAALQAIDRFADYLARGCIVLLQLLDPQALILAGGLVQNNPMLIKFLKERLKNTAPNWERRHVDVYASNLGYHAGVLGAAAVAFERPEKCRALGEKIT